MKSYIIKILIVGFFLSTGSSKAQIINTIAGNGNPGSSGDGGSALTAELNGPVGVAIDSTGNIYLVDDLNNKVRKINATTGIITTIAGNGKGGYSGDNGPATAAELLKPIGVAVNKFGDIYISDGDNQVIRKITAATGVITTIAGNGAEGYGGDNGPATAASFFYPAGMAFDSAQNLYIADELNDRIREVNVKTNIITTVVGNGNTTSSPKNGDNGPATAAAINVPGDVAIDPAGNMYIADDNEYIRKVDTKGIITSIAGSGAEGYGGNGGPATAAVMDEPLSLAIDSYGNVYFSDFDNSQIREVNVATGIITAVAGKHGYPGFSGDGGQADSAEVHWPAYMVINHSGDLIFADEFNNRLRTITGVDGIQTITDNTGINVYPNPVTNGSFNLSINRHSNTSYLVNLYDIIGHCLLSKPLSSITETIEISLPNISSGVYLLKVTSADGSFYTKKIIIDK